MSAKNWIFQWAPANQISVYGPTTKDMVEKYAIIKHNMQKGIGATDSYYNKQTFELLTLSWKIANQATYIDLATLPRFQNIAFSDYESGIAYTLQIAEFIYKPLRTVASDEILYSIVIRFRVISVS